MSGTRRIGLFQNVIRFWIERGVDGFRVDAVPHIVEDAEFTDDERTYYDGVPPTSYDYLHHVHTANRPETYDIIKEWRAFLDREFKDEDNHTRCGSFFSPSNNCNLRECNSASETLNAQQSNVSWCTFTAQYLTTTVMSATLSYNYISTHFCWSRCCSFGL
jgi:glycosidase